GFETGHMESLRMGCVSVSKLYFSQGELGKRNLQNAILSVRIKLDGILQQDNKLDWQEVIGASGSVRAIARVVQAQGWCEEGISFSAMKKLRKLLFEYNHVDDLEFDGLEKQRREVFAGGFAILYGLFKSLSLEHMHIADGSLREGVLYDLSGRLQHEDVRERTVSAMSKRYGIDQAQAQRVANSALDLYEQVATYWELNDEEHLNLLLWASRLHEAGLAIAHSGYHKHGSYLAANADMPGFSRQEQAILAALIRGHRRRFPASVLKSLPAGLRSSTARLCVLLRLAVRLNRSRTDSDQVKPGIKIKDEKVRLSFPADYLSTRELTQAELDQEAGLLQEAGWTLCIMQEPPENLDCRTSF
ncbi:MAG TPA: Ppx/GppA family phosphatase, partial [Gammaproteobacteria bacterium]|nr:Ppx/GppA family phosphatase [Gammaproteobacteria bacterium]